MKALPKDLTQRFEALEKRRADPPAMSDLELARRIAFVCAVEGRDLFGEVAAAYSVPLRPPVSDRPFNRPRS